jgi:YidC/Oxa1 family membrane protein insertase
MDTRRLILLMVFTFSLFMLWENWQKYIQPKAPPVAASTTPGAGAPPFPTTAAPGAPAVPGTPAAPGAELVTVKTDLVKATFAAAGGDLIRLELLKHRAHGDKASNLVLFDAKHHYAAQSGLMGEGLPNHRSVFSFVQGPTELAADAQELKVRLQAPAQDGIKVNKVYTFKRGAYAIDVAWEIQNGSAKPLAPHAYYQLQRDDVTPEGESSMVSTFTGPAVYTEAEKYQKIDFSDIVKGKAKFATKADDGWLAMVQHYFVSAWVPPAKQPREFYMRKNLIQAGIVVPMAAVAPGASVTQSVALYAGPQEQSVLQKVAPGLDLVVDYGMLTVIAAPIFWALEQIYKFVGNWGWAIVILTIFIKLAFFPLSAASYKSMAKMRKLTPRMMQMKERFGDDRQRLNQEMMKLYQTEKVNPLGGCLPILVQIPVFIALYWVLLGAVEMRDAPWILWIKDLSTADPYYVLPVLMVVSMLIQTKLNPEPPDPVQAKLMKIMPFAFGVMFFFFPAGLVLYWVVNNILSIAQQWQITRMVERGDKPANDAKA